MNQHLPKIVAVGAVVLVLTFLIFGQPPKRCDVGSALVKSDIGNICVKVEK